MPGSNAGTGQPIDFQCSKCRRYKRATLDARMEMSRGAYGRVHRVKLTGKKRKRPLTSGNAGGRNSRHDREYVCEDCGHTGWSRHIDLQHKEEREV